MIVIDINGNQSSMPSRKRLRLRGYDYSQNGAYFVTLCAKDKARLFGEIVGQGLCSCRPSTANITVGQGLCSCRLSPIGKIIQWEIDRVSSRFPDVCVDKYIIMPNHVHMILLIDNERKDMRQEQSPCPTGTADGIPRQEKSLCPTVGDVICAIKSMSTKAANQADRATGRKIRQYRFHDHIIRNEESYHRIWQYIDENPGYWEQDCFYA